MKRRQVKTLMMLLIERDHGKSIEQLMLDAFDNMARNAVQQMR